MTPPGAAAEAAAQERADLLAVIRDLRAKLERVSLHMPGERCGDRADCAACAVLRRADAVLERGEEESMDHVVKNGSGEYVSDIRQPMPEVLWTKDRRGAKRYSCHDARRVVRLWTREWRQKLGIRAVRLVKRQP